MGLNLEDGAKLDPKRSTFDAPIGEGTNEIRITSRYCRTENATEVDAD